MDGTHLAAIRALVLAADAGSLTNAGRRLGLTPSAVSKQISRLEEALGARLLVRTTRRVRPSAAGLALIQRARPLFEAFDEAAAAVRDLQTTVRLLTRDPVRNLASARRLAALDPVTVCFGHGPPLRDGKRFRRFVEHAEIGGQ